MGHILSKNVIVCQNFVKEFHGRKFNEIEPEACHVSWLLTVHIEDYSKSNSSPE